ncbi:MAG: SPOR domain-containing protein [Prevotellaceae bacterium]|jgi:hypothetical protein|nr:SPOR domain-containing protein [Prevotellaceae bacterium]
MKKIFLSAAFLLCATAATQAQVGVINIVQQPPVAELLRKHVAHNAALKEKIDGFRIRIFSDNAGTARNFSQEMVEEFTEQHPEIPVYREYDNPYFKVSAGDFRSKDEALKFFVLIRRSYPRAYIVSEKINFPPL